MRFDKTEAKLADAVIPMSTFSIYLQTGARLPLVFRGSICSATDNRTSSSIKRDQTVPREQVKSLFTSTTI